ncbi:MAG: hypothetical protein J0L95_13835 [Candidatus Accumulibacter sp.]|uniref:hypothetical protein n=1 Tax=Accumulibacter sp. TaxID=2053492 RepID=UPI001ACDA48E|nr:hypothetical protein [Accumulibacter sp.]MBN8439106.1 hypothetical protein [Accumulibacter sp.]
MSSSRVLFLTLAVAGSAAVVLAIGRRTRHLEQWQLEEGLRNWEDEGGQLAPPAAPACVAPRRPAPLC